MNKTEFQSFVRDVAAGKLNYPNTTRIGLYSFDPELAKLHEARALAVFAEQAYCRSKIAEMGPAPAKEPEFGVAKSISVLTYTEIGLRWFEEQAKNQK